MKITIDGIVIEGATIDEAIQLLRREKPLKSKEVMVSKRKINYGKRNQVKSKIFWTEDEINYILANPGLKPSQLAKQIERHTNNAICVMKSILKTKNFIGHGKYLQKLVNKFYNKNTNATKILVTVGQKNGKSI